MMPDLSAQSGPCAQPDTRVARPHGNKVSEAGFGAMARSANGVAVIDFAAALAGPFLISRAKHAKGAAGWFAFCPAQRVGAAGRAGLTLCDLRKGRLCLKCGDAPLERFHSRWQVFQGFPDRHLVEEFENV